MYAFLKDNICVGIHNLPLDETALATNEKQVELKNIEDPFNLIGMTYTHEKFVETEKTEQQKQIEENNIHKRFLRNTDWKVIRHRDQLELGMETSMTDEEYMTLLLERQMARDAVVNIAEN